MIKSTKNFLGGVCLNIKFNVIKIRNFALPLAILVLSTVIYVPMLKTEKADANAVKTVYFTFDDGPSERTEEILEILSEENIKATFFVIGPSSTKTDERIFRIYSEGHSIGLHTISHSYDKIYLSAENFLEDIEDEREWIYSVTGKDCKIFRFPGGSNNNTAPRWLVDEVKEKTKEEGMVWYDWNADGKDSLGELISAEEIAENVLSSEFIGSETVIVLLHDSSTRTTTPAALKILIKEFRRMGYEFGKLD